MNGVRHIIRKAGLCFVAALWMCGCYNSGFDEADYPGAPPATTTSLRAFVTAHRGGAVRIEEPIVVAGRVTSSDRAGNFYRRLVVEDEGVALAIKARLDGLHNAYPEGMWLTIAMEGLVAERQFGILHIGSEGSETGHLMTDYIPSKAALDNHLFPSNDIYPIDPYDLQLNQLTPSLAGRLVRIGGLALDAEERSEEEVVVWSGEHRFYGADSLYVGCYIRPYADFADRPIPNANGSLTGVLEYNNGDYTLVPRDTEDLDF